MTRAPSSRANQAPSAPVTRIRSAPSVPSSGPPEKLKLAALSFWATIIRSAPPPPMECFEVDLGDYDKLLEADLGDNDELLDEGDLDQGKEKAS